MSVSLLRSLSDLYSKKRMELPILPVIGLIVSLVFFYEDGFSIKYSMKDDMPLKNKPNKSLCFLVLES